MTPAFTLAGQLRIVRTSDQTVVGHVAFSSTGCTAERYQDDLVPVLDQRRHAALSPTVQICSTLDEAMAWVGANPHLPDLSDWDLGVIPDLVGQTLWSRVYGEMRYSFVGVLRTGATWAEPIDEVMDGAPHRGVVGLVLRQRLGAQTPRGIWQPEVVKLMAVDAHEDKTWMHFGDRSGCMGFGPISDPQALVRGMQDMQDHLRDARRLPNLPPPATAHQRLEALQAQKDVEERCTRFAQAWTGRRVDILARIEAGL